MYHGTVECYLPEISRNGLRPEFAHRWQVINAATGHDIGHDDHFERVPSVYLTEHRETAEHYALAKSRYLATKPGENFVTDFGFFTKSIDAPLIISRPVLLTLDTKSLALKSDERGGRDADDNGSYKIGYIEPSRITNVHFLDEEISENVLQFDRIAKGLSASKLKTVARMIHLLKGLAA